MGCACFTPRASKVPTDERFQTTVSVLVHLSRSDEGMVASASEDRASRNPAAPLAPLATALRRNLHDLCDRIEGNMRGVAMMDVQLRSWPPQKNVTGVVFFLALVDHGLGSAGSAGAERLCAAVSSGTARSALLAALAREPLPQGLLRVDALQLMLPPLAGMSPSFAAGEAGGNKFSSGVRVSSAPTPSFARVSEEDEEASQKPGRMARIALERVGSAAGSFTEADFFDGSVHTGYWKSVSAARDISLSRSSSANSIDERHSEAAANAMAERATACV